MIKRVSVRLFSIIMTSKVVLLCVEIVGNGHVGTRFLMQ